jgi:hypothetical protein
MNEGRLTRRRRAEGMSPFSPVNPETMPRMPRPAPAKTATSAIRNSACGDDHATSPTSRLPVRAEWMGQRGSSRSLVLSIRGIGARTSANPPPKQGYDTDEPEQAEGDAAACP